MKYYLPDFSLTHHERFYVGDKLRYATATDVKFIDNNFLICAQLLNRTLYLIDYSDGFKIVDSIKTNYQPDLIDIKNGLVITANQTYKENHPDKGGDEELFKQISVAYDVVGDEEKRQRYDVQRKNPFAGMGGEMGTSFQEMFNSMFNQQRQQPRAHTTNVTIKLGTLESYKGDKKNISFKRKASCDTCTGTGGDKRVCPTCNGAGQILRQMGNGMFIQMVSIQCNGCGGAGSVLVNPCFVCAGTGTKDEIKSVEIKIPHGLSHMCWEYLSSHDESLYGFLAIQNACLVRLLVPRMIPCWLLGQ